MADSRHAMVTNINAQDKDGNTELHRVVGSGSPNSVEKLLKANPGLNSNIQNIAGDTPLHIAVSGGSPNLVEKLLTANPNLNPNIPNAAKDTALHIAVRNGGANLVGKLLTANPNLDSQNAEGDTALHIAAKNGNFIVVEKLVAAGAKTDIQNNDGKTALAIAQESGNFLVESKILSAPRNTSVPVKRPTLQANLQSGHNRTDYVHIDRSRQVTIFDNPQASAKSGQSSQHYGAPVFPKLSVGGIVFLNNVITGDLSIDCSHTVNGVPVSNGGQSISSGYPGMFQPPSTARGSASASTHKIGLEGARIGGDLNITTSASRVDLTRTHVDGALNLVQCGNEPAIAPTITFSHRTKLTGEIPENTVISMISSPKPTTRVNGCSNLRCESARSSTSYDLIIDGNLSKNVTINMPDHGGAIQIMGTISDGFNVQSKGQVKVNINGRGHIYGKKAESTATSAPGQRQGDAMTAAATHASAAPRPDNAPQPGLVHRRLGGPQ